MFAMVLPPRESREALDWTARQSRIEKIAAAGKQATLSAAHTVICCNVIYVVICVVINISIGNILAIFASNDMCLPIVEYCGILWNTVS